MNKDIRTQQDLLNDIFVVVREEMQSSGFVEHSDIMWTEDIGRKTWIRGFEWKTELFEITFPRSNLDSAILHVSIALPCSPESTTLLDSTTVGFVVGNKISRYYFPTGLGRTLRIPAFLRHIAQDSRRALTWFVSYDAPGKCLQKLVAGETVHGFSKGKPFEDAYRYLSSVNDPGSMLK
jgi:hypothetical protein